MNGIGAKTVKRFNGDNLAAGDIITGQPIIVVYKSGSDQWFMMTALAALTDNTFVDLSRTLHLGRQPLTRRGFMLDDIGGAVTWLNWIDGGGNNRAILSPATQAQMETPVDTILGPSAATQHFHPGHPKAGGNLDGTGTPAFQSDYGMGAVTDNGVGNYTLAFDTAFSATTYWLTAWARFNDAASLAALCPHSQTRPKRRALIDHKGWAIPRRVPPLLTAPRSASPFGATMPEKRIVYTRPDNGVSVCAPSDTALAYMCNGGGRWDGFPRGFLERQIAEQS